MGARPSADQTDTRKKENSSMKTLRRLTLGLLVLSAATTAHAADIRPGLWEFRSTRMNVAGLPDLSPQMAQLQQHLKNLPPDTRRVLEQQMAARGVTLVSNTVCPSQRVSQLRI